MSKEYGPNWQTTNEWVKQHIDFIFCEVCLQQPVTLHHIIPYYLRKRNPVLSDNPRFWMLLCKSCHWYANRYPQQSWQIERLVEYERSIYLDGFSPSEYLLKINQR